LLFAKTPTVPGSLTGSDQTNKSELQTEMIFFTSSGRIGIIVDIQDNDLALHLSELQRNMSATIPAVGGTSHTRFISCVIFWE
jgi:DNA damage-binding protein 1